ncbi:hypothetical protein ATI61_113139 [Archangium gephyra]|uniref:Lipase n=1 Tax=Archangium gephyra TaxID=48 RepID=A0AAC8Q9C2_9BACT|nr:hypothetical protein [Archangium gephyra]AKJ02948.1 Hypothetical protein AA314_04574 [Archangium gephyra]REG25075.1 hypothetical protein ATI61_113139 [Archangium gephyra]
MHLFPRSAGLALVAACAVLLGVSGEAHANAGVVFVHGTGDQSVSSALSGYWTQKSVDTMRNGRPYLIVGYPGASCAGFSQCSWGSIVDQIVPWVNANGISSFTVITHSNGSSPLRYMLAHTGAVSAQGYPVSQVTSKISQVIFSAPDLTGTPLADQVTTSGSFLNIANSVVEFFGGGSYNNPAVLQQRTDNMRVYNGNGTFGGTYGATSVGGKPIYVVRGNRVYANLFSSDAHCGGYLYSIGLKAAALLGWGSFNAGTDGFIGNDSSGYFGNIMIDDGRLNHHQSRRSCHNSGNLIAQKVANAPIPAPTSQTYSPETAVAAAGQACNNYASGYAYDYMTGNTVWKYGCTTTQLNNGKVEPDCLIAYGYSSSYRIPSTASWNPYINPAYYQTWSEVCPDSWQGDGICDACLVAKYGFDATTGSSGANDCVQAPPGGSNFCGALSWDTYYGIHNYSVVEALH